jgi:hypothetical protein
MMPQVVAAIAGAGGAWGKCLALSLNLAVGEKVT